MTLSHLLGKWWFHHEKMWYLLCIRSNIDLHSLDNARLHNVYVTKDIVSWMERLAVSNLFTKHCSHGLLSISIDETRLIQLVDEIQKWLDNWILSKDAFFRDGIRRLSDRRLNLIESNGEYLEQPAVFFFFFNRLRVSLKNFDYSFAQLLYEKQ